MSSTKRQVDFSEFFLGIFMYQDEAVVHYKAKKKMNKGNIQLSWPTKLAQKKFFI